MAKGKHTRRAMAEIINRGTGNPVMAKNQKHDHAIVLNSQDDKVNQIWVRFGTLDRNGNHNWVRTMAMGPVKINPGQRKTVAMVDDDQLPAAADSCYYQLLCEILNKDKHPEILMTPPARVMSVGKL